MWKLSKCAFENSDLSRDNGSLSLADLAAKAGLFHKDASGVYSLLTLGLALQRRLEDRLRASMDNAGAHEVRLALLQDMGLWEATGREADYEGELMTTKSRSGARFALSATAEEHITSIMKARFQGRVVDQWVYQIGSKWRDEIRSRAALVRAREFIMMDSYRFAMDLKAIEATHAQVRQVLTGFFGSLGLNARVEEADCGAIGGLASEEFVIDSGLEASGTLELAHSFVLGDRYSQALGFTGAQRQAVQMGCHGVGVSRTMMAWLERHRDGRGFFGDEDFAVVDTVVVALNTHKAGVLEAAQALATRLEAQGQSVLLDDRELSAGKKLADSELVGACRRVVVSDRALGRGWAEGMVRATGEAFEVALAE